MTEKKIINPWTWQNKYGFVQATAITGANKMLICAGQTSIDSDGNIAFTNDIKSQLKLSLDNLEFVLKKADFSYADVVRMTIYTTDVDKLFSVYDLLITRLKEANCHAAQTLLGVSRLAFPELMVEIEATAIK